MPPDWLDWLYILFLSLVIPVSAARSYRQILPLLRMHRRGVREAVYLSSMLSQWLFVIILLGWWWYRGRDFSALALNLPAATPLNLFWLLLILGYGLLVVRYTHIILADHQRHRRWHQRLQSSPGIDVTPAQASQLRLWWLVSLTAGVCEELIYRAFTLWLLGYYLPLWLALPLMALLFGLGHRYQGLDGIAMTGTLGLLLGLLFVSSGSLWLAALAHLVIDASHGWAAYRLYHGYVEITDVSPHAGDEGDGADGDGDEDGPQDSSFPA